MPTGQYDRHPGLNDGLDTTVERRCSRCLVVQPISEYSADHRSRPDGVQASCKGCRARAQAAWRKANPEEAAARATANYKKHREKKYAYGLKWRQKNRKRIYGYALKSRYGLTLEQHKQLLESQGHLCAICGKKLGKKFHTDHDHKTGAVRGVLCGGCNLGLGFYEKRGFAKSCREYLKRHRSRCTPDGAARGAVLEFPNLILPVADDDERATDVGYRVG